MSKPYHECPKCGAHLDHGEHCDCKDRQQEPDPAAQSAGKLATGNRREPVLMPGATAAATKYAKSAGWTGM